MARVKTKTEKRSKQDLQSKEESFKLEQVLSVKETRSRAGGQTTRRAVEEDGRH